MKPSAALAASGSRARSWPSISTRPAVGLSSPAIIRMVVVLPAPFGPRKPWISPGSTSRLTPSTAVKRPYFLTSSSTRIIGASPPPWLRPAARTARVVAGKVEVEGPRVGQGAADEHGVGLGPLLEVEDLELGSADQAQDGGLLVEPATGQAHVGRVGGELVQG